MDKNKLVKILIYFWFFAALFFLTMFVVKFYQDGWNPAYKMLLISILAVFFGYNRYKQYKKSIDK
jgi:hypothetical protein